MTKKSLGRQIAILRQDSGLNQSELAERMGVSVRTVSGWETGDRPPKFGESLLLEIRNKLGEQEVQEEIITPDPGNTATALDQHRRDDSEMIYQKKYEKLMEKHISVMEENSNLKNELLKKAPLSTKKLS